MRLTGLTLVAATVCGVVVGQEFVSVPWDEIKALYRERVERELRDQPPPEIPPFRYAIETAAYRLEIGAEEARGVAQVSGRVISGKPAPIPLFGTEIVLTEIADVQGGAVYSPGDGSGVAFMPENEGAVFGFRASFVAMVRDVDRTRTVNLGVMPALSNTLELTLPDGARLATPPGIRGIDGRFHVGPGENLSVNYLDKATIAGETESEIDTISIIEIQKSRILFTVHGLVLRSGVGSAMLRVPQGARLVASSLRSDAVKAADAEHFAVTLPPAGSPPFSIEFSADAALDSGPVTMNLPAFDRNSGQQGRFIVREPDDGEAIVVADGLVTAIPVDRLGKPLRTALGDARAYMRVPSPGAVQLAVKRFQSVGAPSLVLETVYLFASFDENGNVLSILTMDLPEDAGPRLKLNAVPAAEIWSVRVNDAPQRVYTGEEGTWIVPLKDGQACRVELAFLRQGEKLGLHGVLDAVIPETGLPSQELRVGIALPPRVELLSLDGTVSPARGESWKRPAEFIGKPYYFSRSFYKGEGMSLALAYKEPVNTSLVQTGGTP